MRTIDVSTIVGSVRDAVKAINFHTSAATMHRLVEILEHEESLAGRQAMTTIVENRLLASSKEVPMCQDSGMVVIFVELGQEVHIAGGNLCDALVEGVRLGYREGYLRPSVVRDPLFERCNTGDNTPPVVHFQLVRGDQLRMEIAAKGFGAENMSWAKVLTPAQGIDEVKRQVVRCVEEAGPNACPPVVVGVGLGGTLELAAYLAKKALMREMRERSPDPRYAALELELLDLVNATGIGPQGWGGLHTAMDVRIEYYPTHMAAIPLAVNLDCHLQRHTQIVI